MSTIDKTLNGSNFCGLDCIEQNSTIHPETCSNQVLIDHSNNQTLEDWLLYDNHTQLPLVGGLKTGLLEWLETYYPINNLNIPTASTVVKGGIKVGYGLIIDTGTATLSVDTTIFPSLDTASFNQKGGIKLGNDTTLPTDFIDNTIDDTNIQLFPLRLDGNSRAGIAIPETFFGQVQSDWNQTNNTAIDFIKNKPIIFSGDYNDLSNKPSLFSGNYYDLTNRPNLFSGNYNDLSNKPTLFSGDYNDLLNKPAINNGSLIIMQGGNVVSTFTANSATDVTVNLPEGGGGGGIAQQQSDWTQTDNTSVTYIQHKPSLATVATTGSYNDLSDTPQADWNQTDTNAVDYIKNKPTIPAASVQSNWAESDTTSLAYIQNKPTLFSGNYNDLTNKPTIPAAQQNSDWNSNSGVTQILNKPAINNNTITLKQGSVTKGTFTLNQSSDATISFDSYSDFVGTDGNTNGISGLVPAPATTDVNKFLKSDGTWATVSSSGSATDVQINGTSIISNNTANILTNTAYNAGTNKIATMSDVPNITLPNNDIVLSTSNQTYITKNSTSVGISLPSSDPYNTARTPSAHTHGNITNDGRITSDTAVSNGDKLVITDASSSDSHKIARSSIAFGSDVTKYLRNDGTWAIPTGSSGISMAACATVGNSSSPTQLLPIEYVGTIISKILNTSNSNDNHHIGINVNVHEYTTNIGIDGRVPAGAIILLYAAYLYNNNYTFGRLVVETLGYGDYYSYVVCDNDENSYKDASHDLGITTADVLTANNVTLITSNWSGYSNSSTLPTDFNDYIHATAIRNNNEDKIGGGAEDFSHHKYIFTFMNIEVNQNNYSILSNIVEELKDLTKIGDATKDLLDNIGTKGDLMEFFTDMIVTCEHRSSSRFTDGGVPFYGYDVFNA